MGLDTRVPDDASAEQVDLLRRRVLNVVGHELRTPVTTLTGLAQELAEATDEVRRRDLAEALARAAERVDVLVRDLLLASEITTLVPVGDPEPVPLHPLVEELWDGGVIGVSGEATALARPAAVRGVLVAILDNAKVHGEAPIEVTIGTEGDRAVVEVASAGAELSADDVQLACEAFYRGERAVTTAAGLGLGLAVARTLARADGGDVSVRGGVGGGMVARIELPAA